MLARRKAVAPSDREAAGRAVAALLLDLPAVDRAARSGRVAFYAELPDELPLRPTFEALSARGARCLFPRLEEDGGLRFAAVGRWDELRPGAKGVLAPPADRPPEALLEGDVVLVPGVAFDRAGRRLGRGGGHYDRALADRAGGGPLRIGVAYRLQLVPRVPHDSRDRPMDAIVTEQGWVEGGSES